MPKASLLKRLELVLKSFVKYFITLLITPAIILLGLLLVIPRWIIWLLAKCFRPDLDGFVNGLHRAFTLGESANFPLNIMGIAVVNGVLNIESVRLNFQDRVLSIKTTSGDLQYRGLQTYWVSFLGHPFWKRDRKSDLGDHVRDYDFTGSLALPLAPSEAELHNAVGAIIDAPWPKNKSPWEILLVHNYRGKSQTAVLFRLDHVLADGLSIFELFKVLTQSKWPLPKINISGRSLTGLQRIGLIFKIPKDLVLNIMSTIGVPKLPFQKNGKGAYVIFGTSPEVSVDVIKGIKNHFSVSYAAVVYAAVSGAIARALEESGQDVPKDFYSTIIFPKPNHPGGLRIHAEGVIAKWSLRSSSPEQRLRNVHRTLKVLSQSAASIGFIRLARAFKVFPVPCLTPALDMLQNQYAGVNVGITTMPVTTGADFYEGMEILELITVNSLIFDSGMMISVGGVNNKQRVSFCVNKNMFASADIARSMGTYFVQEIQELANATT